MTRPTGVRENVPLAQYTTYKLGGPARYFLGTHSVDELAAGLAWATSERLPVFVLGGGSNILVSDAGFPGLAVHWLGAGIEIQNTEHGTQEHGNTVSVGAGAKVEDLLEQTLAANLIGLECMAGVPGEVGGAIRGNAGTFGQQIGDYVVDVDVVSLTGERRTVPAADCGFSYRHSNFKQTGDIILGCRLQLQAGDGQAGRKLVAERLERRWKTQPRECSAGCVFKNFRFDDVDLGSLRSKGLDVDKFAEHRKLPAAYVIEAAGLKGTRVGDVESSPVHANFLVNHGTGTASQVDQLIAGIKKTVLEKYGLELQEEVQRVGF
jgi:UDP-N-acetylmuramate dehydrogenase